MPIHCTFLPSFAAPASPLQAYPNKVRIHYTVDRADDPQGWRGSVGHISKAMLKVGRGGLVQLAGPALS